MKSDFTLDNSIGKLQYKGQPGFEYTSPHKFPGQTGSGFQTLPDVKESKPAEIVCITSYPPRECGLATYSHDLINALQSKFGSSFSVKVCAIESDGQKHEYPEEVGYILNTESHGSYATLLNLINRNGNVKAVMIQHEFGLFHAEEEKLLRFLQALTKPVVVAFHTVLPDPAEPFRALVQQISGASDSVVVMTYNSSEILVKDYGIPRAKITVIPHGTHLVPHLDKSILKDKYGLSGKKVLSTFGLISSGKSIDTTIEALPAIVRENPDVVFLVIGKTHPSVVRNEGEKYRAMLEKKVIDLNLKQHVRFINRYIRLPELLEYLQLTDIYLFTSKDPNQAVSGTFSYAISCGCSIVSTPIPHAKEILKDDAGIFIEFGNSFQLSKAVLQLLGDEDLRRRISINGLHRIVPTSWENSAIAHAALFKKVSDEKISIQYSFPKVKLDHLQKMTTDFGIIQFSVLNQPDLGSGFTLDDNARALIAMCQHYELTQDKDDLEYIGRYLRFVRYCLRPEGYFLNYVNERGVFTDQNNTTNLADANGRAIWALGHVLSIRQLLPLELISIAENTMEGALRHANTIHSTRAMAFIIKGLHFCTDGKNSRVALPLLTALANRLVQMYRHESGKDWQWFESYLTYANAILPEAMLCAYAATKEPVFKEIAKESFDFLLAHIFNGEGIKVISNKSWLRKGEKDAYYGEQPIDVAYTILALGRFYDEFQEEDYLQKMRIAYEWFLGRNHLRQIIYNPCTGGCHDGLEETHVNLNQGAESTVCCLMSRLTIEKYFTADTNSSMRKQHDVRVTLNR